MHTNTVDIVVSYDFLCCCAAN